jgi:hypothetical protein
LASTHKKKNSNTAHQPPNQDKPKPKGQAKAKAKAKAEGGPTDEQICRQSLVNTAALSNGDDVRTVMAVTMNKAISSETTSCNLDAYHMSTHSFLSTAFLSPLCLSLQLYVCARGELASAMAATAAVTADITPVPFASEWGAQRKHALSC